MLATYNEDFTGYFRENSGFKYNFYTLDSQLDLYYFTWFKKKGWAIKYNWVWFFTKEALQHYQIMHPEITIEYV